MFVLVFILINFKLMDKHERLQAAIKYLKIMGDISIQQDIVDRMKANKSTVSLALNGNDKYLTNSFLHKFNFAFGCTFNEDWLISGKGEMLNNVVIRPNTPSKEIYESDAIDYESGLKDQVMLPRSVLNILEKQANSLEKKDSQIDELINMLKSQLNK